MGRQVTGLPRCRLLSPQCRQSCAMTGLMEIRITGSLQQFLSGARGAQKTCHHCNNCKVRTRSKIGGWQKCYKACFISQKAGYASIAGRQSAEANMTRRQQAGSQKSKEQAGFSFTSLGGIRYRKQGCKKRQSKNVGDYCWPGYCVRLMRKMGWQDSQAGRGLLGKWGGTQSGQLVDKAEEE